MGLLDKVKNILTIPDEDEFDNEYDEAEERTEAKKRAEQSDTPSRRTEQTPRVIGNTKNKTVSFNPSQMQVVLVKPERYDDVKSIADHLNDKKTVVLNLETAEKEIARRIVDFLGGATYANHGIMRKVSKGTYLIVPNGVDMMGESLWEDLENNGVYTF